MAIVKFPALSLDASGSIGDLNYYKHNGVNCARAKPTITDPNTSQQQVVRGFMTSGVDRWKNDLSADQRVAWGEAAKTVVSKNRLGDRKQLNGYNYFLSLWIHGKRINGSPGDWPPTGNIAYGFTDLYSDWVGAYNYRRFQPLYWFTSLRPDGWELWYAGPYDYEGRMPIAPDWRYYSAWTTFGTKTGPTLTAGKWYWFKVRWNMLDGRTGEFIYKNLQAA